MAAKSYDIRLLGPEYRLSEHFRLREFASRDGAPEVLVDDRLVMALEDIRRMVGRPVIVRSGYRTPEHNSAVGGEVGSRHTTGEAADIFVAGVNPERLASLALTSPYVQTVGIYDWGVHVSVRRERAVVFDRRGGSSSGSVSRVLVAALDSAVGRVALALGLVFALAFAFGY